MKKVLLLTSIMTAFLFTGCAHMTPEASSNDMQSVEQTISTAEAKYADVHAKKIAWQKTKEKITQAKKLVKEATDLANEAIYEADQAQQQSDEADKVWRSAVPQ